MSANPSSARILPDPALAVTKTDWRGSAAAI